jgi:pimeloyl-ACP methyl ester carboxylesterase
MKRFGLLFVLQALWHITTAASAGADDELPRRPFVGIQVDAKDDHVKIVRIFPNSSASRSELKVGDTVRGIDDTEATTVSGFLSAMKGYRTGDRVKYRIERDKKDAVIEVALTEWPRERANDLDILYDSVETKDARLRCILTKPKTAKPGAAVPAVLYIQGIDGASIEAPFAFLNPMRELIYALTRAGFAVMRCEKSGVGDSTGKPCEELGLHEEVVDFVNAVKKLKSYDFVDGNRIFLFGHSAGGWVAPLVASEEPVQGILVYGTVVRPFAEYLVENRRRNERLRTDRAPVDIEDEVRHLARFLHYVLAEKREVEVLLKDHPELAGAAKVVFPEKQGLAYGVRHLGYFREINDQNIARVWEGLGVPVLAIVGEFEIRTTAFDHEYIAEIVNSRHPGTASWKEIPKMDHGLTLHTSLKTSVRDEFKGPFGPQVALESVEWIRKTLVGASQ